jgi:radical SAM superfamily enzyme YgiQ (UPF0313 family)
LRGIVGSKLNIWLADLVHTKVSRVGIVPLGIGYLASALQETYANAVQIKLFKYPDRLISEFRKHQPDMLGLSNYVWNHKLSLRIARLFKESNPKIMIIMGGPHTRIDKKGIHNFLQRHPYVDAYIPQEAEYPICSLVGQIIKNDSVINELGEIPGCYLNVPDYNFHYMDVKGKHSFNQYGSPYLKGILDEFIADPNLFPLLETNRGCPYRCTYCAWGAAVCNKIIKKSSQMVIDEAYYIANKTSKDKWYLTDGNFGIYEDDIKFALKLKEIKKEFGYPKRTELNCGKNAGGRILEISHILGNMAPFEIAVQSLDPDVLRNIRRKNLDIDDIRILIESHHNEGRKVGTDLLVGCSGETLKSHIKTLRACCDLGFDSMNINNIRMLPGTQMETDEQRKLYGVRAKFRFQDAGYGMYAGEFVCETDETIVSTNTMSEDEINWLKKIHFLIYLTWSSSFAKPLLSLGLSFGINPIDVMLILEKDYESTLSRELLIPLYEEHKAGWFETEEDLTDYYTRPEIINDILIGKKRLEKLTLKYLAYCLNTKDIIFSVIDNISQIVRENTNIDEGLVKVVTKIALDRLKLNFLSEDLSKDIRYELKKEDFNYLKKLRIMPSSTLFNNHGFTIYYRYGGEKYQLLKNMLERFNHENEPAEALYTVLTSGMGLYFTYSMGT